MPNEALRERNLEHALQTAYTLFLAHGIENTTKSMLVKASRISRSSIDRYFPSKADWVLETAGWVDAHVIAPRLRGDARLTDPRQSGLAALRTYMELVRDLMYEQPELFVLGAECRAYLYRNCTEAEDTAGRLRQTLGSSELLRRLFVRGMRDGSIRCGLDAAREAILTREALLGFLASMAITRSPSLPEWRPLVDACIDRILELYSSGGSGA